MSERARRGQLRFQEAAGVSAAARPYVETYGTVVQGGPFEGLTLVPADVGRILDPVGKLVGSYEAELHRIIEEAIRLAPPLFINLGSADGYYAVGFARRSSATRVHAFELAPSARRLCRRSARANGVADQITLHRRASARSLTQLPLRNSVVLCDCEGAELDIFTDDIIPQLRSTLVVIELHEAARPGVSTAIRQRFRASHTCEIQRARPRDIQQYPILQHLRESERSAALNELRSDGLEWGIFSPR
jgi:hypothetical protein